MEQKNFVQKLGELVYHPKMGNSATYMLGAGDMFTLTYLTLVRGDDTIVTPLIVALDVGMHLTGYSLGKHRQKVEERKRLEDTLKGEPYGT